MLLREFHMRVSDEHKLILVAFTSLRPACRCGPIRIREEGRQLLDRRRYHPLL